MLSIFNIQKYSIHDGNGVRTNIFFKGCPLRCLWCNNPESLEPSPSLMYDERLCHNFGECMKPGNDHIILENGKLIINRHLISDVSVYNNICPSKALFVAGQEKSIIEIIREIEKDIPYYQMSDGGVTLTGGEPFSQEDDLIDLIAEIKKRGIHLSVETSLHVAWEVIEKYLGHIDMFLADLKHTDSKKFMNFTGGNAALVLDNFKKLDEAECKFIVRVPVIPGFNYSSPELKSIIDFASELQNASEIHFIPFHSLAKEKYTMLGLDYHYSSYKKIEKSDLTPFADYSEKKGLIAKILN